MKIVDIEVPTDSRTAQPGLAQPHNAGRRLRRTAIATSFAAIVAFVTAAYVSLASDNATVIGRFVPDSVAYESHVMLGGLLAAARRWPDKAANQWVRAASHARSQAQLDTATTGLAQARADSNFAWALDDRLCTVFLDASANARTTISGSGTDCSLDPTIFTHVEIGSTIVYTSRPPIGGPHYSEWYPDYGMAPEVVAPGYWVHNLEHGGVVLLFKCQADCSAISAQLEDFYAQLPAVGHNERLSNRPRLLITQYSDMDHPFAIIAWGHRLQLDRLDADALTQFYVRFVDRGPECRNLVCPI